jgi:tetratricopeptide (TPR) repeat protein
MLMVKTLRPAVRLALLALLAALPPLAQARAEPGSPIQDVELRTIAGGKAHLLSAKAKANVFVFFRTGQDRSLDALKQMAACEKDFAGKAVYWAAVVSGSEVPADVQAVIAETGIKMPVLVDDGDVLYDRLGIRLHPMVGIVDSKSILAAMEPYRQIEYCDVIKTRIKMLIGEASAADLEKVTNPEKTALPGADPMKKAQRDVNMARRLYEIGQYKDAVKFANKALEVAPVAHAFTVMGQAYAKMGKCAEAGKAFDQAVKLDAKESAAVGEARAACK